LKEAKNPELIYRQAPTLPRNSLPFHQPTNSHLKVRPFRGTAATELREGICGRRAGQELGGGRVEGRSWVEGVRPLWVEGGWRAGAGGRPHSTALFFPLPRRQLSFSTATTVFTPGSAVYTARLRSLRTCSLSWTSSAWSIVCSCSL
jgi:hypothetical protein